ncbi:hypothetical protein C5Z26_09750 [Lactobacillus sp. CBA3606]|nr:hypothetical protein C5Z26_09750 [Lactobacillus sp. CBA3606]
MDEVKREGFAVDLTHRPRLGLMVIILFGLFTLSGCASTSRGTTNRSTTAGTTTHSNAMVLTKANQQISHQRIATALQTLATAKTSNATIDNLTTGLKYYQKAAVALNDNELSLAKGYFATLTAYQGTTDATFIKARAELVHQYQQVKLANSYYNTARDELSVHALARSKTAIDKLDQIDPVHPVIKQLQKKALAMKQAIMNYEASQSTSSGQASSAVASTSMTSSSHTATTSTTSSSVTAESSTSSSAASTSSETAASQADESTSSTSSRAVSDQAILSEFKAAATVTFAKSDQFNVLARTTHYYQIEVSHAADTGATSTTDIYRYYPMSGQVEQQANHDSE